ncbi:CUE1, KIS4 [Phaffia rhodozyma]|uniref:CUE1, KIS4 n=1 Tax=Phaffia rhodozyma TaxID=264483 RepID=A0A0F7SKU4_PHARH|nr:CUE1, KIS4 [Phaffia rhodozyma]
MEDAIGIIVAVAVIYVAYSWVSKRATSTQVRPSGPPVFGQGILRGVSEPMVDTVSSAFPDIPRENIMYDLSKTRNPQITVEKILTTGILPPPPPGMFPASEPSHPPARPNANVSSATTSHATPTPTLLERYNLQSRVSSVKGKERAVDEVDPIDNQSVVGSNAAKWESTAKEREDSLKKRKEAMVLEARRKLLAKKAKAQEF